MDISVFNSTNLFCFYVLHSGQAYSDYATCPPSPSSFCFFKKSLWRRLLWLQTPVAEAVTRGCQFEIPWLKKAKKLPPSHFSHLIRFSCQKYEYIQVYIVLKLLENTEAKKSHCGCLFFTVAWRYMTDQEWNWATLIVKAHHQSLYDRTGAAQWLPSLRIIGI